MASRQLDEALQLFNQCKQNLSQFAKKHRSDLQQDALFRTKFHQMCTSIGVDPISSAKGIWTEMLGGLGTFYYEIGVHVVQVCIETRSVNGGMISFEQLLERVKEKRNVSVLDDQAMNEEDMVYAIEAMNVLGHGYQILNMNGKRYLQSIPREMNVDTCQVLSVIEERGGKVNVGEVKDVLEWEEERCVHVLVSTCHYARLLIIYLFVCE